jgi:hypothetical protein
MTSAQFRAASFALEQVSANDGLTIAASPSYSWIISHVNDTPHTLRDYRDMLYVTLETDEVLLFIDPHFKHDYPDETKLKKIYGATEHLASFEGDFARYNKFTYPYANLFMTEDGSIIEVRKGSSINLSRAIRGYLHPIMT